jgi:plasmid stability protein
MSKIDVGESKFEMVTMAKLTVRNVSDEVHRALRMRSAMHGHGMEAEVRAILEDAVKSEHRVRLGDALADIGRHVGLTNEDFAELDQARDKTPAEPMRFESVVNPWEST